MKTTIKTERYKSNPQPFSLSRGQGAVSSIYITSKNNNNITIEKTRRPRLKAFLKQSLLFIAPLKKAAAFPIISFKWLDATYWVFNLVSPKRRAAVSYFPKTQPFSPLADAALNFSQRVSRHV